MDKKRSVRLIVLEIIFIFFGIYGAYELITFIQCGLKSGFFLSGNLLSDIRLWVIPSINTLLLLVSIGIFNFCSWARKLAIFLSSVILLFHIVATPIALNAFFKFEWSYTARSIMSMIIDQIRTVFLITFFPYAIYYLTRSKVKEQFK